MTESCILLLVEDNPDDVFLMRRALKKAGLNLPLHVATDGRQAIEYLSGTAQYGDRDRYPLPSMVFLDLKLPYLNGFEVLEWIREHPELSALDVSILTSSPEDRDKETAQRLGVRAYLVKPPTDASLREVLENLRPREMTANR